MLGTVFVALGIVLVVLRAGGAALQRVLAALLVGGVLVFGMAYVVGCGLRAAF